MGPYQENTRYLVNGILCVFGQKLLHNGNFVQRCIIMVRNTGVWLFLRNSTKEILSKMQNLGS